MLLADAVEYIAGHPKPLLCLDTCVYLDVLNRAFSGQQVLNELDRYECLHSRSAFHPIVPAIVATEYNRNIETVTDRAKQTIRAAAAAWSGLRPVMQQSTPGTAITDMDPAKAVAAIDYLATRSATFLGYALSIETDDSVHARASRRECAGIRPAQRGKDSIGDCLICETLLALTKALRANRFIPPVIFVSTNIHDFADANPGMRGRVHPDLASDFAALNIQYESVLASPLWRCFS